MIAITYLPLFVTILFRGMPGVWQHRHRLVLCWLIVMQALFPGRKTLEELARWTPGSITVWRLRRVLKAAYWDVHLLVAWWGSRKRCRPCVSFRQARLTSHIESVTSDSSHQP
jgi:hypothetical protein